MVCIVTPAGISEFFAYRLVGVLFLATNVLSSWPLTDYRHAVFDPDWFYYTVCGFCRNVCWPKREDRLTNRKLIINSGTAALMLDGSHVVSGNNTVEVQTPFGLNVVLQNLELSQKRPKTHASPGQSPLDREVVKYLKETKIYNV